MGSALIGIGELLLFLGFWWLTQSDQRINLFSGPALSVRVEKNNRGVGMEEALRVSVSSNGQLGFPSDGYGRDVQISMENWIKIPNTDKLVLPKSDLKFPHGAPLTDVVFIKGHGLFEKKKKTL